MIGKKHHSVFIVLICCFLLPSGVLFGPASAGNIGATVITAKISLIAFDISVTDVGQSFATITWKTNGNADSNLEYGLTTDYGFIRTNPLMEINHSIILGGLSPGTLYHMRVVSHNKDQNSYVSTDYTFLTLPGTPYQPEPDYSGGGTGGGTGGTLSQNISSGIPTQVTDTKSVPIAETSAIIPTAGTALPAQTATPVPTGNMQWTLIFSTFIIIVVAVAGCYFVAKKK
jgi:hypothetical protein